MLPLTYHGDLSNLISSDRCVEKYESSDELFANPLNLQHFSDYDVNKFVRWFHDRWFVLHSLSDGQNNMLTPTESCGQKRTIQYLQDYFEYDLWSTRRLSNSLVCTLVDTLVSRLNPTNKFMARVLCEERALPASS